MRGSARLIHVRGSEVVRGSKDMRGSKEVGGPGSPLRVCSDVIMGSYMTCIARLKK